MGRIISFLTISFVFFVTGAISSFLKTSILPPTIEEANYNQLYTRLLNSSSEYIFVYQRTNNPHLEETRVTVESNATNDFPLIVVVKQKGGIFFWQTPMLENLGYSRTSHTLCSLNNNSSDEDFISVTLSTASSMEIRFTLRVVLVKDFYIRAGQQRNNITLTPSEPVYYAYSFDEEAKNKSVVVHLESDSEICMIFSIQNKSCPVFDLERNIQFSGYWQTVSKQGGITISREKFPDGFFIVLVVKNDDKDCTGVSGEEPHPGSLFLAKVGFLPRMKIVNLTVIPGISTGDYIIATLSVISVILAFCVLYIVGLILYYKINGDRNLPEEPSIKDQQEDVNSHLSRLSSIEEAGPRQRNLQISSLDRNIEIIEEGLSNNEVMRKKLVLCVCDLACKDPMYLETKSNLYIYFLGTVAIFYTLPVLQLVITDQIVLQISGNQDLCYYNFLCAHPVGFLSDFNHVYSNIGYVLLGFLFIFLSYLKKQSSEEMLKNNSYGIPQHYGLFYALGIALIIEGVLSGSYHFCPGHSNFQFDTSFMYVIAVLCIVKIYQNRHPDIFAQAPVAFGFLALIFFLGLIGVLNGSKIFWIFFTITHLVFYFVLTAQLYYLGRWKLDRRIFHRLFQMTKREARLGLKNSLKPVYPTRLLILLMAYLYNLGLAIFGYIHHAKDFSTYLLVILMTNLLLYLFFYIVMKLCHKERILLQPAIYLIISFVTWSSSVYFFMSTTTSWSFTPAQSRIYNSPCLLLNFFDTHDIWHFLSALAMFFSFMILLTLDDDLSYVHRSQIPVF